jgi:hypothetical protein
MSCSESTDKAADQVVAIIITLAMTWQWPESPAQDIILQYHVQEVLNKSFPPYASS